MIDYKKGWYNTLLLIVLYVLSTSTFFFGFISDETLRFWLILALRLSFIVFLVVLMFQYKIKRPLFTKGKKSDLFLLPLLLITITNLFVVIVTKAPVTDLNQVLVTKGLGVALLAVLAEELVFRVVLIDQLLKKNTPLVTIVISALIFGSIHLANITSLASILPNLVQVAYTTCLGLGAGLLYVFTKNFVWPFLFHLLFNILNGVIIPSAFAINIDYVYYLVNGSIAVLIGIYGILIYIYLAKKEAINNVTKDLDF